MKIRRRGTKNVFGKEKDAMMRGEIRNHEYDFGIMSILFTHLYQREKVNLKTKYFR